MVFAFLTSIFTQTVLHLVKKMKGISGPGMDKFVIRYKLGNSDVDMHMKLRTSAMFALMQQAASLHCDAVGLGPEHTLGRGFLWVITRQKAEINVLPRYEDEIVIETWPGITKHVIFPRYYRILDADGNVLVNASSVWTLIDASTRSLATFDRHGISLEGLVTGEELSLPRAPQAIDFSCHHEFTVPYSYIDINGHMNNTRYFDLTEDLIESPAAGDSLKSIVVEYSNEATLGEKLNVSIGRDGKRYYVCGSTDKPVFKILLDYNI